VVAEPGLGAGVAATMLLTTLSLFHLVGGYMARDQENTIFDRDSLPGAVQLRRYGVAFVGIVLATELGFLQRILDTVGLTIGQWAVCVGLALTLVVAEELVKLTLRRRTVVVAPPAVA
jgi:Ca2+-transporting ATPase